MADTYLYFNFRGKGSRSPVDKQKCLALLNSTFGLDMAKLDRLSGPMMSEAYTSFIIMMVSLEIIKLSVWLPPCYGNWAHNFETGIE